jgi:ABC-type branched-subunit amino acid transport system ATPase component
MELFEDLTVRQNLGVSHENRHRWGILNRADGREHGERLIDWTLELLGLNDVSDRLPGPLPLGVKKLVGVGRALSSGARLVLLDEPAAGLDTNQSRALAGELRRVSQQGITVALVDHDMDLVFEACEEIHVLNFGRLLAHGTVDEVKGDPQVRRAYLGEPVGGEEEA